jgi:hypothetical protein
LAALQNDQLRQFLATSERDLYGWAKTCGFTVQTNFLGLSKIALLISNKNQHKISNPLFRKSTKFWFELIAFISSDTLASGPKKSKHFVRKLSIHPLCPLIIFNKADDIKSFFFSFYVWFIEHMLLMGPIKYAYS